MCARDPIFTLSPISTSSPTYAKCQIWTFFPIFTIEAITAVELIEEQAHVANLTDKINEMLESKSE